MTLDSEQINQITIDVLNGREPRIKGKEADEFRKELEADIKKIEAEGGVVEVPMEWEA